MIDWITLIFGLFLGFIIGALCTKTAVLKETTKLWIDFVKEELKKNGSMYFHISINSGGDDDDGDGGEFSEPEPECGLCNIIPMPNGYDVRLN